jgi:hypothetical protein
MRTILSCIQLVCFTSVVATAQLPLLSSYPSATAVIFLDFDGQTVSGTSWNGVGPLYCQGAGLSAAQVTEVYNRVAEDYRPFNINITTDSSKYVAAPLAMRMRVIVTVSSDWFGIAGGVSFVSSFTWGDDTPCFVFSALLNYNTKNISEAVAHEAGHTLGLFHQAVYNDSCIKTSEYNFGQGFGEIGWAPIMGVGYYQNLTLWYNGPNPYGCTNYQSDLDILTSGVNGFSYRNDDHGSAFTGATNTVFVGNGFQMNGVVERSTDKDFFKFTLTIPGKFQLNAAPFSVGTANAGSDLDIQVSLYNSSQTLLKVVNPGNLLNSGIDSLLSPGTYYLKVEGTGNIYASNYASLGSYSLIGNLINAVLPLRKLELHGTVNNGEHRFSWIIDADEPVAQQSLEVSYAGNNFTSLNSVPAAGRSYDYRPNASGIIQYRLNVTFDNGRQYYSNIVALRTTADAPRPRLISNLINANTIEVSSPGIYNFAVCDLKGIVVMKGKLSNGSNYVTLPGMTGGMYIIRYSNAGAELPDQHNEWVEKFVRR